MSRHADVDQFYDTIEQLRQKSGGFRLLRDCTGKTGWPNRGLYFFFEEGELRSHGDSLRVVRVGTHALTDTSKTTLWNRLSTHRGQANGRGNHRGSIFRKRIGEAILVRSALVGESRSCPTWGQGNTAPATIREAEAFLETEVSSYIGRMPFLWLSVDDAPGKASSRGFLERNCIGLLSNFNKPGIDTPSQDWLGHFCEQSTIRESGLWNTDCVKDAYTSDFLDKLGRFVTSHP